MPKLSAGRGTRAASRDLAVTVLASLSYLPANASLVMASVFALSGTRHERVSLDAVSDRSFSALSCAALQADNGLVWVVEDGPVDVGGAGSVASSQQSKNKYAGAKI